MMFPTEICRSQLKAVVVSEILWSATYRRSKLDRCLLWTLERVLSRFLGEVAGG